MKINKKFLLVVVLLVGVLFVLAGCGTSSASPTVTVTETTDINGNDTWSDTTVPDTTTTTVEEDFLYAVRAQGNYITSASSDSTLLDAGWATCNAFDAGYSVSDIILVLVGNNPSQDESYAYGVIIAGAGMKLCPQYTYLIEDYLN